MSLTFTVSDPEVDKDEFSGTEAVDAEDAAAGWGEQSFEEFPWFGVKFLVNSDSLSIDLSRERLIGEYEGAEIGALSEELHAAVTSGENTGRVIEFCEWLDYWQSEGVRLKCS